MDALWLASAMSLREEFTRASKAKQKEINVQVTAVILEEGEEYEPEPLWVHYLLDHRWPEDF